MTDGTNRRERYPRPPIDPEVDLTSFPDMMLDVKKLMASDTWAMATGDEAKAMITLWCRAWHQVPAGSLPDDDRILSSWSGAGISWPEIRDVALRGFTRCNDGRIYHRVIAQKAATSWNIMRRKRKQTEPARNARKSNASPCNSDGDNPSDNMSDNPSNIAGNKQGDGRLEKERKKEEEDKTRSTTVGVLDRPPPKVDPEIITVAENLANLFAESREEHFPDCDPMGFDLSLVMSQAVEWLSAGLPAEIIGLQIDSGCRTYAAKQSDPPRHLGAFKVSLGEALARINAARSGGAHLAPTWEPPGSKAPEADSEFDAAMANYLSARAHGQDDEADAQLMAMRTRWPDR